MFTFSFDACLMNISYEELMVLTLISIGYQTGKVEITKVLGRDNQHLQKCITEMEVK